MAFTAGTPEMTKAHEFAAELANLRGYYGNQFEGRTAAQLVEKCARSYGFEITGFTTGAGFPPFGTFYPQNTGIPGRPGLTLPFGTVAASLQNPRGETMAGGISLGNPEGQTVGIYLPKFVRDGKDFVFTSAGTTLSKAYTSGITFDIHGPVAIEYGDRIIFEAAPNTFFTALGTTSAITGLSCGVSFQIFGGPNASTTTTGWTGATGSRLVIQSVGITRGTIIAGITREFFSSKSPLSNGHTAGFTAAVYFNFLGPAGLSGGLAGVTGGGAAWGIS